nr:Uncharacterised protein [Klebsiella pneumoniae]
MIRDLFEGLVNQDAKGNRFRRSDPLAEQR